MKKEDNVSSPLEVIRTKPGSFCNKAVRNLNERQVDIICNRISESGLKPEDVGVMAPYRTSGPCHIRASRQGMGGGDSPQVSGQGAQAHDNIDS